MNYFLFLKQQQEKKKLKKQAQVQENIEITFMSAWFVIGVFLVLLIIIRCNPKRSKLMREKSLTKKQYQKDIIKYVAQILACAFLLGIIFFSIFKEVI